MYTPESATEILGRPISSLVTVEKLVANYSEIFREIGVSTPGNAMRLHLAVLMNGVEVVSADRNLGLGGVQSGNTEVDVADAFAGLAARYGHRIEEKAGSALR